MIKFKLFAGTDIGLRDNNEDNFIVCSDLTKDKWMVPADQQEPIQLGQRGCLVVVADGMGGMNAGEVASDIAIKTVRQLFAPSVMPANTVEKADSIRNYLRKVIVQADLQVKQHCKTNPDTEGMGSTIVMAWLIGDRVYIGWMGDSRAYSYKKENGIVRLSKDHSYVQQLVDAKMLTEQEAMDHPDSNVITRSLGDSTQKAKPEIVEHTVEEGEIILLCSDGLCGVCTDSQISDIIQKKSDDLRTCKEVLTTAALKAGGSDNITVALLKVEKKEEDNPLVIPANNNYRLWYAFAGLAIIVGGLAFGLRNCRENIHRQNVENVKLLFSADTLSYGDTITYKVVVSPSEAIQDSRVDYDSKLLSVDTLSHKIYMKKNNTGNTQMTAVSLEDSTKKDTVTLCLFKKREQVAAEVKTKKEERATIDLKIGHSGALEAGKTYNYSVSIKPTLLEKGGYTIKCDRPTVVTINDADQTISVSSNLKESKNCTFTVTSKAKHDVVQQIVVDLKASASEITSSTVKMTEINKIKEQ